MRTFLFCSLVTMIHTTATFANECPWRLGSDIINPTIARETKPIEVARLEEDLDCLEILINHVYVASRLHPQVDFKKRISDLKATLSPKTDVSFLKDLFSLHRNLVDLHLSYSIENDSIGFKSTGTD